MKKAYINPTTEIVNVETAQMIAASPEGFNGELNGVGAAGSSALSNDEFDIWSLIESGK